MFEYMSNCEAVRAATHYHTRAWQTLMRRECYIVIVIYLPFQHTGLTVNGNKANCCRVLLVMKPPASNWSIISRIATC